MARVIQAGNDFATDGERRAAEELARLPANWTVIANKVLPTRNDRSFEIDFIVIGDHLVFAIDEKSWRGRIHGSDVIWVREDGSSERSPLNKIDYVAKVVAGHIRTKVPRFGEIAEHVVVGCVLLTGTSDRPAVRDPRAARGVFLLSEVVQELQMRDYSEGSPRIAGLRSAIESTLFDLSDRPKFPKEIGGYRIRETTIGPIGSYKMRATHSESGERILSVYNLAGGGGGSKDFYLQEFRAVRELRDTGLVPEVQDPFSWSDDFLVVPSMLPSGVSLNAFPRPGSQRAALDDLALAATAFKGLCRIHERGVVHRALTPEALYVVRQGEEFKILFTDFFAARRGERTIAPRLDELVVENPYLAPEVAVGGYGFASRDSDTYSLALILLERISGVPVGSLIKPDGLAQVPTPDKGWRYFPEDIVLELVGLFRSVLTKGLLARPGSEEANRPSAQWCVGELERLQGWLKADLAIEQGKLLDKRYRVERVLGTGASARTYLATDLEADGLFALKQFLRPASMSEAKDAKREFTILRNYPHRNLPRVYDVYPLSADVHVKLEYIEGVKLTDALPNYLANLERWHKLSDDLLAAVEHLESHQLLHRDIKPDNVIIRDDDGRAILIDLGSATPAGAELGVAGTPGYLPPEAYFAEQPPPSTDHYALGVLLFLALFGRMPFEGSDNSLEQQPLRSIERIAEELRPYAAALLRAVSEDPGDRYTVASEFRLALHRAKEPAPPASGLTTACESDWLDSLRGLYRNSTRGNSDNRGLDTEFAQVTYVPTLLDERLLPAIIEQQPRAVFLSGNPGDGKTAFLEQMRLGLSDRGAMRVSEDESGWEYELEGHTFRACYDASESHGELSANEQLLGKLSGLQGDAEPEVALTVLVAINDGRLADITERFRPKLGWLMAELERAGTSHRGVEASRVWLVDLKQRAYVSLRPEEDDGSVMRRVLRAFVDPKRWPACAECDAGKVCPVWCNVKTLSGPWGKEASARLEHLLLLAHLSGRKHITMRDLRSGLAFLITADLDCEAVQDAYRSGQSLPNSGYWQLAFQTGPAKDVMLGELESLDPARYAQPALERFLFFRREASDAGMRGQLFYDGRDVSPDGDVLDWLGQLKRRLYFEAPGAAQQSSGLPTIEWRKLLPYRHGDRFIDLLSGRRKAENELRALLRGIGRSEGLSGVILDEGLCLKVADSEQNRLTVMKQFPVEQFSLLARTQSAKEIETVPQALDLTHRPTGARLEVTLDLFELLLRLADGLEPGSPELRPLLEDLAPFKGMVQLSNTRDLLLIEGGRRRHKLSQIGRTVVRTDLTEEVRET